MTTWETCRRDSSIRGLTGPFRFSPVPRPYDAVPLCEAATVSASSEVKELVPKFPFFFPLIICNRAVTYQISSTLWGIFILNRVIFPENFHLLSFCKSPFINLILNYTLFCFKGMTCNFAILAIKPMLI